MIKFLKASLGILVSISLLLSGCNGGKVPGSNADQTDSQKPGVNKEQPDINNGNTQPAIDLEKVKPNEAGKIMVVMFHNFVETYKSGDKEYTTTFDDFRNLLQTLYDKGYRLVNVNDYLNNNIAVPAGTIPIMFTFDDGTAGQFNLVEENGTLVPNKNSAVWIMEEFNKTHPDFGLKGTFYVNLGLSTFEGKGTVAERLKYLTDKGFEIGNHTLTHIHLNQVKSADKIFQEVGGNQKKLEELIPGYKMNSLALPFGQASKELQGFVAKGEFEGIKYENLALMEVGANPTVSPVSKKFKPISTARVRAQGIKPVDCDLTWWLKTLTRNEQYVSDGNPNTVSIPKAKEVDIDMGRLNGKKLITY